MEYRKSLFEPFPLFGVESIIHSKGQALKVLRLNSYYIFIAGFLGLFGFFAIEIFNVDIGVSSTYALFFAFVFFAIGFLVYRCQSRVASIISIVIFLYTFLRNIYESGFAGFSIITLLFIAASYRSVKASFFYHKKS
jgi:hypothetical protein